MRSGSEFFPPYAPGTVVRLKDGVGIHIIADVAVDGVNEYHYATNRSAWHNHDDLIFVSAPSAGSIKQLVDDMQDEEDSILNDD